MDTGEHPTQSSTPKDVSLGEVYRGQRRLEREFGRVSQRLDEVFEQNIPSRVSNLEKWRDWTLRIVIGGVIVALMGLLFATGGTVT